MINKTLLLTLSLAFVAGCGGAAHNISASSLPRITIGEPSPTPTPTPITSSDVFSNVPQTWNFIDVLSHRMTIAPNPITCAFGSCGDISVWHYTKDSCAGYWNPHTPEQCAVATTLDELYFVLRHDPDGAWRCIGFTYLDYLGVKTKVQINPVAGQPLPYTIIPVSSVVSDLNTSYNAIVQTLAFDADLTDFSSPAGGTNFSTTWRTDASADGSSLVSFQHEGCVTEKWTFTSGLETVAPIVGLGNNGICLTMDSRLVMHRVH
jgi:hypothetical protein